MLEGTCPICKAVYHGWALQNPKKQFCEKCGTKLVIIEDDQKPLTIKPKGGP